MNSSARAASATSLEAISSGEFAAARAMIGQKLRIHQWTHQVSPDTIRRYAHGLGDDNPLWCDENYGLSSPHGLIVAPPTFPYAVWPAGVGCGFPKLEVLHAGGRWEIQRYLRPGERVEVDARLADVKEINGKRAGRMILQTGEVVYSTREGEVVARHVSRSFRVPVPEGGRGLSYATRNVAWSGKELDALEAEILAQTRRGKESLFWEDVAVGSRIPGRVKGPLNMATIITYSAGNLGGYLSTDMQVRNRHLCLTQPELAVNSRPPEIQARREAYAEGHFDATSATRSGMPGVYDNGWMRIGWAQQMLTDWVGDHGVMTMLDGMLLLLLFPIALGVVAIMRSYGYT